MWLDASLASCKPASVAVAAARPVQEVAVSRQGSFRAPPSVASTSNRSIGSTLAVAQLVMQGYSQGDAEAAIAQTSPLASDNILQAATSVLEERAVSAAPVAPFSVRRSGRSFAKASHHASASSLDSTPHSLPAPLREEPQTAPRFTVSSGVEARQHNDGIEGSGISALGNWVPATLWRSTGKP